VFACQGMCGESGCRTQISCTSIARNLAAVDRIAISQRNDIIRTDIDDKVIYTHSPLTAISVIHVFPRNAAPSR